MPSRATPRTPTRPLHQRHVVAWLAVVLAAWQPAPGRAADAEFLSLTAGVRMWMADWTTWAVKVSSADYVVQASGGSEMAVIPLVSVRYGRFSVSLSSLLSTEYDILAPSSDSPRYDLLAKRSEFDINGGYQFFPGLTGTLGYKTIKQDFATGYTWSGPIAGVAASSELRGAWGLYGSASVGAFKLKASDGSLGGQPKATYVLGEMGLAYAMGPVLGLGNVSATAGYRSQVLRTRQFPATSRLKSDVQDTTQGLVLGLFGTF